MSDTGARASSVRERIAAAAHRAGRSVDEIELVAVSKTQPIEAVREVLAAGVRVFGENRVQEGVVKVPALPEARWHFIGRLQRNKARRAVELFELIHGLDSVRLAETLARLGEERGRPVDALIEVNVGGEGSKGGVAEGELDAFAEHCATLSGLRILGLMAIPPFLDDPEEVRPYFRALAAHAERLRARKLPNVTMRHLSMGMSGDFEVAIEEGATLVRVGTALFGPRRPWPPTEEA